MSLVLFAVFTPAQAVPAAESLMAHEFFEADSPPIHVTIMKNNLPSTLATLLLAPLAALPAAIAPRPNVLFIAVDDLRPELGCYGNQIAQTPSLDRLAAGGLVFNHAYCQQAVCSPSRSSLMTSRRPDATRVWDLETHFRVALPDAITLPQHFKANGYYCAALSKIYHHGFEDGRSWSEPHWYPSGQTIDTDPVDWTKRMVKRVGPGVQEYRKRPMPVDNDQPAAGLRPGQRLKGAAFEISPKSDDEKNDAAETVNLAGKPEHKAVVEALSKHLPAHAAPLPASTNAVAAPVVRRPARDRVALFERKDVNHDGKLSREEFMANQPDPEAAAKRWETFDSNQDGFLSRDEFIHMGAKAK